MNKDDILNPITTLLDDLDNEDFKPRKRNLRQIVGNLIADLEELKEHMIEKDGETWIKP